METALTTRRKPPARCSAPAGEAGSAAPDTHADAPAAFTLPERLDSRAAGALAEALLPCRHGAMVLDASAVGFVGARCAEVLLAARLACREAGQALTIVTPSEGFVSGLEGLGLADLLADTGPDTGEGGAT